MSTSVQNALNASREGTLKVIENGPDAQKVAVALVYLGDCIRALSLPQMKVGDDDA